MMREIIKYNTKGEICGIETDNLIENFQELGYAKISSDEMLSDSCIVRVSGKFIERCSLDDLRPLALSMTKGRTNERSAVRDYNVLTKKFVNQLNKIDVVAFKDTKDVCHFFFKNGVLKIFSNGEQRFCGLDEIDVGDSRIWKTSVLDMEYRAFGRTDYKDGVFYKFCQNVVGEDGIEYLMRALGYLLHSYKNPSNPKAIIFSEGQQDDSLQANGGTGKSLIAVKALQIFRTVSTVDGKAYDPKNRFKFQGIKEEADIAALEDVPYNFKYEDIYNFITGDSEFERKNMTTVIVPFERSPKFIITTNYGIPVHGESDLRRRCVIGFKNHYSSRYTPYDEFGHNLFSDWKDERTDEWQKFFLFMAECVKLYFAKGIESFNNTMIENVALRKFFGNELYDYCLLNYNLYIGEKNAMSQKELYDNIPAHIKQQSKSQEEFTAKFNRMMKSIGIECRVLKKTKIRIGSVSVRTRIYVYNITNPELLARTVRGMDGGELPEDIEDLKEEDVVSDDLFRQGLPPEEPEVISQEECPF